MADQIKCDVHGEGHESFVCQHLLGDSVALGFNRNEPDDENPFPDAWCDDCEIIRKAHDGWTDEAQALVKISLLCSGCYNRARIRNTRPSSTLEDLKDLRWKCGTCEEWHTGPCLDFAASSPIYWTKEHESSNGLKNLLPSVLQRRKKTFLNDDYCSIEDRSFFVRGLISLPIIGTAENFCWGVWGSLSRENFQLLIERHDDPNRVDLPPMFSWLSNQFHEYPDMLEIKMRVHIRPLGLRPEFEIEHTDHPLSQEFHHGITPERVKQIMKNRLHDVEG